MPRDGYGLCRSVDGGVRRSSFLYREQNLLDHRGPGSLFILDCSPLCVGGEWCLVFRRLIIHFRLNIPTLLEMAQDYSGGGR